LSGQAGHLAGYRPARALFSGTRAWVVRSLARGPGR
jgi:hypothetical protein